ncbi:hypothetical protein N7490_007100 [Penicillium lividum]|nr:hypothetical protein N7490_007100 [Penicillium lividum]
MIHAVEIEHSGLHDASVVYIAATPTTETNIRYIKSQLEDFLKGSPSEDFPDGTDESKLVGYLGETGFLSEEARKAMGYGLWKPPAGARSARTHYSFLKENRNLNSPLRV